MLNRASEMDGLSRKNWAPIKRIGYDFGVIFTAAAPICDPLPQGLDLPNLSPS